MKAKQIKQLFAFTFVILLLVSLMGCDTKANSKATTETKSIASESTTVKETTVITTAETELQTTVSETTKATTDTTAVSAQATTIAAKKAPAVTAVTTTEKKVTATTAPVTKATTVAVTTKAPAATTAKSKVNPLDYNPDYYARPRVGSQYFGADPGKEITFDVEDSCVYEITSVKIISAEIQQRFYTSDEDVKKATTRYVNNIGDNGTYTYIEPIIYGKSPVAGYYTIEIVLYCKDLNDTVTLTTIFSISAPDGIFKEDEPIVTVNF